MIFIGAAFVNFKPVLIGWGDFSGLSGLSVGHGALVGRSSGSPERKRMLTLASLPMRLRPS